MITEVEESYVILNAGEFQKEMQANKRVKDPKLVEVAVETPSGPEQVYVFRDPESAGRKLRIKAVEAEELDATLLASENHLHSEQGQLLWKAACRQRMSDTMQKQIIDHSPLIVTVEEYKQKLMKSRGESYAATVRASNSKASGSKVELQFPKLHGSVSGKDDEEEDDSDDEPGDDGSAEPSSLAPVVDRVQAKQFPWQAEPCITPEQPTKKAALGRSASTKSLGSLPASSMSGVGEEAAAEIEEEPSEDDAQSSVVVLPPDASSCTVVNVWVSKLDLMNILKRKKLGRQVHWAGEAANKMEEQKYALELRAHIRLAEAESLFHKDVVAKQSTSKLLTAAQDLKQMAPSWPLRIQEIMTHRLAADLSKKLAEENDDASLLQFCW